MRHPPSSASATSIGQYGSDRASAYAAAAIATASIDWHDASAVRGSMRVPAAAPAALPSAEAEQEHGEDQRERVHGPAEQQRQVPSPEHFGRERRHARQRRRDIDRAHAASVRACVGASTAVDSPGACRRASAARHGRDAEIQRDGDIGCDVGVVDAQQIKPGDDGAEHAAGVFAA